MGQNGIVVYQGKLNESDSSNFFSTEADFASDYGEVKSYLLTANNIFDSSNLEHLKLLFASGSITDPYDERIFNTAEEYCNSDLRGANTWESMEPLLDYINGLGFDAALIYEGGVENYYVFYPNHYIFPLGENNELV